MPYMPHMSLKPGHMARFNALYAPHVPQPRTHGAHERRCEYTKGVAMGGAAQRGRGEGVRQFRELEIDVQERT